MFGKKKMTPIDFIYTHRLSDTPFVSDWVRDLYYAEKTKELVLETTDQNTYLYTKVPVIEWNKLVNEVRLGNSVGNFVNNNIKTRYGPYTATGLRMIPAQGRVPGQVAIETAAATTALNTAVVPAKPAVPDAVRTEVQYTLDGKVAFMRSTKPADEALNDYLISVSTMGLNAELEAVHIYFKEEKQKP